MEPDDGHRGRPARRRRTARLDALFRVSPAGPVPAGVLDGVAILFPGSPLSRPLAALVRAVAWQGKVIDPDGTRLRQPDHAAGDPGGRRRRPHRRRAASTGGRAPSSTTRRPRWSPRGCATRSGSSPRGCTSGVVWLYGRRVAWFTLPRARVRRRCRTRSQSRFTRRCSPAARRRSPRCSTRCARSVEHDGGPFAGLPGVHFARLFVLPGDAELEVPDSLVYLAEVDAPLRAHLGALAGEDRLAALFAQCDGYPERRRDAAPGWAGSGGTGRAGGLVRAPGRPQRRRRSGTRPGCATPSASSSTAGAGPGRRRRPSTGPSGAFVAGRPDLAWALRPAAPPGVLFRARATLHRARLGRRAAPASRCCSALPGCCCWCRRLERRDVAETRRGPRASSRRADRGRGPRRAEPVHRLRAGEARARAGRDDPGGPARAGLRLPPRLRPRQPRRHPHHPLRPLGAARRRPARGLRQQLRRQPGELHGRLHRPGRLGREPGLQQRGGLPADPLAGHRRGARRAAYKHYLRNHQLLAVWFGAYPTLSARNIDANGRCVPACRRADGGGGADEWLALL